MVNKNVISITRPNEIESITKKEISAINDREEKKYIISYRAGFSPRT